MQSGAYKRVSISVQMTATTYGLCRWGKIMLVESALDAPIETANLSEASTSAVSWGAVVAGAVGAAALSLLLLAFGAGMGFAVVSPWSSSPATTTFHVATGLYLIVMAMMSSAVGGYLAGRLRKRWTGTHTHEVFFRDTAHGFLAWALATLLSVGVLATTAGALVNAASVGFTRVAGESPGLLDEYVDALVRGEPGSGAQSSETAARADVARVFAASFRNGEISASDRTYLTQLVVARTGLNTLQAEARVNATIDRAKVTADKARKAAAQLALWLTASLLVGAFAASAAAIEGGGLRDGTWKH
jgi:hypothetical protein